MGGIVSQLHIIVQQDFCRQAGMFDVSKFPLDRIKVRIDLVRFLSPIRMGVVYDANSICGILF
jgi:hypothetical protein